MELKKTTILSAFVVIAGILAEIIFRDTLSKSFMGVALSVALAVVVLVGLYFAIDGVYCLESLHREEESRQQRDYEQRVYTVLNEQLKFQKAVYREVKDLQQLWEQQPQLPEPGEVSEQLQEFPNITKADLQQLASEINENTMQLSSEINQCIRQAASDIHRYADQAVSEINSHTTQSLPDLQEHTGQTISEAEERTARAVSDINEHTTQAVKVVAKYIAKNSEELKEEIRNH